MKAKCSYENKISYSNKIEEWTLAWGKKLDFATVAGNGSLQKASLALRAGR